MPEEIKKAMDKLQENLQKLPEDCLRYVCAYVDGCADMAERKAEKQEKPAAN